MIFLKQFRYIILVLFGVFLLSACSNFSYSIKMAKSMRLASGIYPTYEVDFIGLTVTEKPRFEAYSVDEYFSPGNQFRKNVEKVTMYFSDSSQGPFKLSKDNPIWEKWQKRGVTEIVVIANLPGIWAGHKGLADGRRLALPLDKTRWPNGQDVTIKVNPSGLILLSPLLPPGESRSWFWWL